MICYQENTKKSPAVQCSAERFWRIVGSAEVKKKIENLRKIRQDVADGDYGNWLKYIGFIGFCRYRENGKDGENFKQLSDQQKLLQYAENLKRSLPGFIFGAREFDETAANAGDKPSKRRVLEGIHLNGLFMFDVDHINNAAEIYLKTTQAGFPWRVMLAHETSSKQGLRLVCVARIEIGNIADNQIELAHALGVKADSSCIDASRTSFAPMKEEIFFIDDELFTFYNPEFDNRFCEGYRKKQTGPIDPRHKFDEETDSHTPSRLRRTPPILGGEPSRANSSPSESEGVAQSAGGVCENVSEKAEKILWRGFDLQAIIDQRFANKLPCKGDSNRHSSSLKLASDLLIMLDGNKAEVLQLLNAQNWVQEIIAERNEHVDGTVDDAAANLKKREKESIIQYPSREMQAAIKKVTGLSYRDITCGIDAEVVRDKSEMESHLWEWGAKIEAMFEYYPALKDVCKGLKQNQYPAALFVAGGFMMTLMTRCRYRFYHRPEELRRLNNCTLIIGDPGSGKSFATSIYEQLIAPIKEADEAGIKAINDYRAVKTSKGDNKDKPVKPKAKVRNHPSRTSNSQFITDMVNTRETVDGVDTQLHMVTFDSELDNSVSIQNSGKWIDKTSMELKAFHNEEDGQAYSNSDSVMQMFKVYWNYVYTGTPLALRKIVNENNFGTGLATRLTCIPMPSTKFKMMDRETTIDHSSNERLREWAYKLDKTKGELSMQKIVDELYEWTARRMEDAKDNDSEADELLTKRCAYHAVNFSAPYIVMRHWDELHQEGEFWCGEFQTDEIDWQLAELIVNIQYACQQYYFGAMAEKYFDDKARMESINVPSKRKTSVSFLNLPEEFTYEDVKRCFDLTEDATARKRISRLQKDHLIEKSGEFKDNGTIKFRYRKIGFMMF